MHPLDITIFIVYMLFILGIGYYFMMRNKDSEDYYVGGRNIGPTHVGLSVVATDVGGGFSIGLGGLGFIMGISGSWMLFTGLLGAWLSAVFLIPKIKNLSTEKKFQTLPEIFNYFYNPKVAMLAALISAIGYFGFTSSQMLAGAKLASATFLGISEMQALIGMGIIIVVYTVMGGIKAVIYTDTFQWIIIITGLVFIGIPISLIEIGGIEAVRETVRPEMLTLTNLSWQQLVNWAVTIVPIWFVGMTLYQRIYASRSEKEAKKAWYIAGVFEWPIMAFMGVLLGLFARVAAEQGMFAYLGHAEVEGMDVEMGLPFLLRTVLPAGLMGLMMAVYFSAIMSTADSCLVASSGNTTSDLINKYLGWDNRSTKFMRLSQVVTLVIGAFALLLASKMENVLDLMLYSYAFMVSGLFIPIVGALYWKKSSPRAAFAAMLAGGLITVVLQSSEVTMSPALEKDEAIEHFEALSEKFPLLKDVDISDKDARLIAHEVNTKQLVSFNRLDIHFQLPYKLDPNIFGMFAALLLFISLSLMYPHKDPKNQLDYV
jgi:solute:Na+ symporter, SSS family